MIVNLYKEHNLRGYMLEYAARVLLRRDRKNNFIFLTSRFDSIDEIILKYKIKIPEEFSEQIELFRKEWRRCDIIEFYFKEKESRIIKQIQVYEVKSKFKSVKRSYYEMCLSGKKFFDECKKLKIPSFIVSMSLLDKWIFGVNIFPYEDARIRTYSNVKNSS